MYNGQNMIWYSNGERSDSRGKTVVDAVVAQLRGKGFL